LKKCKSVGGGMLRREGIVPICYSWKLADVPEEGDKRKKKSIDEK